MFTKLTSSIVGWWRAVKDLKTMNAPLLAMLGSTEMIIIAIVVLVLFGAKKVPELMKGVGTGIKEFKRASRDVQDELQRSVDEPPAPPAPPVRKSADTVSQGSLKG